MNKIEIELTAQTGKVLSNGAFLIDESIIEIKCHYEIDSMLVTLKGAAGTQTIHPDGLEFRVPDKFIQEGILHIIIVAIVAGKRMQWTVEPVLFVAAGDSYEGVPAFEAIAEKLEKVTELESKCTDLQAQIDAINAKIQEIWEYEER